MKKKIGILLLVLITLSTVGMITLIGYVTWNQYQDTKAWTNTKLTGELKDVPPFLARDYVKAEDKDAVEAWQAVEQSLKEIETNQGITKEKRTEYEKILQKAVDKQTAYEITTGEIVKNSENLRLYLDIEIAMETAYETSQTKALQNVTNRLYASYMDTPTKTQEMYFEKLREIATDYQHLFIFLSDTLPTLGVIENGTLTVATTVGENITKQVKTVIEEQTLTKFPYVQKLYDLLTGSKWTSILKRNQISREYQKWMAAKEELESLSKTSYYGVSTIVTYQQAMDAGLDVEIEEREGYTIDPNSPVSGILYDGVLLQSNQYIRYGTPVIVQIEEQYIEIPKPEEPKEEESEQSEEKPGDDDSDWEDWPEEDLPEKPDGGGIGEEKPDKNPDWSDDWSSAPNEKPEPSPNA